METLNTAARAAGFAMASDEAAPEKVEAKSDTESWRAGEARLLDPQRDLSGKAEPTTGDWLKSLLGVFGRGAPA